MKQKTSAGKSKIHTPGPWKAVEGWDGWKVIKHESGWRFGEQVICDDINQGYDMGEFDAKLIAAAPELLDNERENLIWLTELLNWYQREAESFDGREKQMYLDHARSVRIRIQKSAAAIKKATT